jgi:hypothetical protein
VTASTAEMATSTTSAVKATTSATAAVKATASATTMPAASMLCQGRARENCDCYRRYKNQHELQKRGDFHWGPPTSFSATTGQLGMRATVIAHLIPDVHAWLQHSKSCISRTAIAFCAQWTTPQITQHAAQYLVSVILLALGTFYNSAVQRTAANGN